MNDAFDVNEEDMIDIDCLLSEDDSDPDDDMIDCCINYEDYEYGELKFD